MIVCWIITFCIVMIWGYFDAPNQIISYICNIITDGKIKTVELKKPWGCTLCMTAWTTFIVLLFINPAYCWMSLIYAFSTKFMLYAIQLIDKLITKIFIKIDSKL